MSGVTLKELKSEVLSLPDRERAELAHELVRSLDPVIEPNASDLWEREIACRLDQIDAGTASLVDRDELRRRMHLRLADS